MARRNAFEMVRRDPMLRAQGHRNIREALMRKFGQSLGLADIG